LIREDDRVVGARLHDRMNDSALEVRARVVVNATGVWLDRLRGPRPFPTIRATKGTHLFLPRAKVGNRHALALTTNRDGRLISVAGGKFTTHRAMAEAVVDMVEIRLGERPRHPPSESAFGPPVRPLEEFLALGVDEPTALDLQGRYAPDQVARYLDAPSAREPIVEGRPHVWAEVDIAVHEEMALTLTDVLIR